MKKIALVVHRYGLEVNGGAESHCRLLAKELSKIYDVEVLTTCAINDSTWSNHYIKGNYCIDGIKVRRFETNQNRDWSKSKSVNLSMEYEDEIKWIQAVGPYSLSLFRYIHNEYGKYKAIIFFTYLYYSTAMCILGVPNAILLPTAHKETPIFLQHYKKVFESAKGIIYNTKEEKELVEKMFNVKDTPNRICGIGINHIDTNNFPEVKKKYNLPSEYVVYAGRINSGKGCDILMRYFKKYKKRNNSQLKLVLVGKKDMDIKDSEDIILTGFVSEEEKNAILHDAKYTLLASRFESLSMLVLESMYLGTPVLVTSKCDVLRGHIERSHAGLTFNNYKDFEIALNLISSHSDRLDLMRNNGRNYVNTNYNWDTIVHEISELIENINSQTTHSADSLVNHDIPNCESDVFLNDDKLLYPAFPTNNIAIALACDDNYVPYLSIVIQSIIEHIDSKKNYDILVFSDGISLIKKEIVQKMVERYHNVEIRFIDVSYDLEKYSLKITNKRLSRATFLRLLMPQIMLNYDKVLYIDCDTIVMNDLAKLYEIDLGNYLVAAIPDPHINTIRTYRKKVKKHLIDNVCLSNEDKYFNAGVILFNLKELRKKFSCNDLFNIASSKKWMWEDQDVLNFICKNKIYWLDYKWNFLWVMDDAIQNLIEVDKQYLAAKKKPYIIHYAGGISPNIVQNAWFTSEFWDYAEKTPYYELLIKGWRKNRTKRNYLSEEFYNMINCIKDRGLLYTLKRGPHHFKKLIAHLKNRKF